MLGTFYLSEHCNELAEYFRQDREIVRLGGPDELVEKACYFPARDAERERVRLAGHRRALAEHTQAHRLEELLERTGVSRRRSRRSADQF